MIELPLAFRQAISGNRKKYLVTARITLANSTVLNLTNAELWESGGFSREEAVSEDNKFTAIGSTIIGSASLSIKNLDESYSSYDFTNAKATVSLAVENVNPVQVGVYTVDEATYSVASINLSLLDNMEQFDRPYVTNLGFPATLFQIVMDCCLKCGVTFDTSCYQFPNYNLSVPEQFDKDNLTFREVIGMVAAMAGCYAKCNPAGQLTFGWFDRTTLDRWIGAYSSSSTMPPAASYTNMHYITSLFSQDISVDPITITGVQTVVEKEDEDGKKQVYTEAVGSTGYVISVEKNNVLNACTNAQITSIRNALGNKLIGLTFRKASLSHSSNPAIEAGDIAAVWDRKGRGYPILVTRMNFGAYEQQKTVSGCETPLRNAATRYTWSTKNYMTSQKRLNEEQSLREQVQEALQNAIDNATGLYLTPRTENGATIYYLHNLETLEASPVRIMFSTAGISVTANGTASSPTWYGLTANGTMLVNLLATTGLSFDWAHGGTLKLGGAGNGNGLLEVYDANNQKIGGWDNTGIDATGDFVIEKVFNNKKMQTYIGEFKARDYNIVDGNSRSFSTSGFCVKYNRSGLPNKFGITTAGTIFIERTNSSAYDGVIDSWGSGDIQYIVHGRDKDYIYTCAVNNFLSIRKATWNTPSDEDATSRFIDTHFTFRIDDNGTSFNGNYSQSSSSKRYKHDINYALTSDRDAHRLLELPVAEFVFNKDHPPQYADMEGKTIPGIIAEDVEKIYPSATIHNKEGEVESWDERRILPGMLALIQEQARKIEQLEARIAKLEGK